MKKNLLIIVFSLLILLIVCPNLQSKQNNTKKKGVVSKVKDAAAHGFGWQLGKEGAKAVINKGKEKIKNLKDKTKKILNKSKNN